MQVPVGFAMQLFSSLKKIRISAGDSSKKTLQIHCVSIPVYFLSMCSGYLQKQFKVVQLSQDQPNHYKNAPGVTKTWLRCWAWVLMLLGHRGCCSPKTSAGCGSFIEGKLQKNFIFHREIDGFQWCIFGFVNWAFTGWWFGTWILFFPSYWECHHPNWRTPSFFRGVGQPPTSHCFCPQKNIINYQ